MCPCVAEPVHVVVFGSIGRISRVRRIVRSITRNVVGCVVCRIFTSVVHKISANVIWPFYHPTSHSRRRLMCRHHGSVSYRHQVRDLSGFCGTQALTQRPRSQANAYENVRANQLTSLASHHHRHARLQDCAHARSHTTYRDTNAFALHPCQHRNRAQCRLQFRRQKGRRILHVRSNEPPPTHLLPVKHEALHRATSAAGRCRIQYRRRTRWIVNA